LHSNISFTTRLRQLLAEYSFRQLAAEVVASLVGGMPSI